MLLLNKPFCVLCLIITGLNFLLLKENNNQEKILIPVGRLYSGEEEEPPWPVA